MSTLILEDNYRHKGMRRKLIDELRRKGINDSKILDAFMKLPRHFFLDSAFEELAYEDQALHIAAGQTISQPYTVAYQTYLLDVKPGLRVLEIGTGSGYQACILSLLGAKVYSIERHEVLFKKTMKLLDLVKFVKMISILNPQILLRMMELLIFIQSIHKELKGNGDLHDKQSK